MPTKHSPAGPQVYARGPSSQDAAAQAFLLKLCFQISIQTWREKDVRGGMLWTLVVKWRRNT